MSLAPGTRFGPYEIGAVIGAGGMGQVFRARDTRLDRDVAVKVLPESFASDPDRRARFEREAKAVAALTDPNIVSLFDTGTATPDAASPVHFVVMELLDGETQTMRADAPPALDRILRHCLEKNPGERFQTARDVAFAARSRSWPWSAAIRKWP